MNEYTTATGGIIRHKGTPGANPSAGNDRPEIKAPVNYSKFMAVRRRREVTVYLTNPETGRRPPPREKIVAFTESSGQRLRRAVDNSWCAFRVFGTLTYPQQFPTDGREVKRHWKAFIERLRRIGYLQTESLVWWLEFQQRGAPHFHFLATRYIDYRWVAGAWAEITNGNVRTCSSVEKLKHPESAGAYAAKYAAKREQKTAPPGFTDIGRWWGRSGRRPTWEDMPTWFRAHVKRAGWSPRAMTVPKVAAATSRELLKKALMHARARATRVHVYVGEHGVSMYGDESELNLIWWLVMGGEGYG